MSDLRDHFQAIYDKHGELTPELVVQVARRKNHPLHERVFDRPPEEAAESYYRERAHTLIQSVQVVVREATETVPQMRVRAFHATRTEKGYSFEPLERVVEDDFTRKIVLQNMEREWRSLFTKYETFTEFLQLVKADVAA